MTKLIAVIDDEAKMEQVYTYLMENQIRRGLVSLEFFADSRKFMEWLETHTPDLILSDIHMPHLSGINMVQMLKKTGRSIPTYFVSGHDENEFKAVMRELGIYRFISKPFNFTHVSALIELDLGILSANL